MAAARLAGRPPHDGPHPDLGRLHKRCADADPDGRISLLPVDRARPSARLPSWPKQWPGSGRAAGGRAAPVVLRAGGRVAQHGVSGQQVRQRRRAGGCVCRDGATRAGVRVMVAQEPPVRTVDLLRRRRGGDAENGIRVGVGVVHAPSVRLVAACERAAKIRSCPSGETSPVTAGVAGDPCDSCPCGPLLGRQKARLRRGPKGPSAGPQ